MESPSELVQACRELEQACRTLVRVLFQPFECPIRWMLDRTQNVLVKLRITYSPSRRRLRIDTHRSLLEILEQWERRWQERSRRRR